MARLLYQGHGSLRITAANGETLYVDPFAGQGYDRPAALVLVTHEHFDHNAVERVCRSPGAQVLRAKDFLKNGHFHGKDIGAFNIQSAPAGNKNHDPAACVGYIIRVDDVKVYCAGDTSSTAAMEKNLAEMSLDYALLPTDGVFNMDAEEASHCAALIGAKHSIPIHTMPVHAGNNPGFCQKAADAFHCSGKLVLQPGEEIFLS